MEAEEPLQGLQGGVEGRGLHGNRGAAAGAAGWCQRVGFAWKPRGRCRGCRVELKGGVCMETEEPLQGLQGGVEG